MFRDEGNIAFSKKEFQKAISSYRNALIYLDYSFGDTDEQDETLDEEQYKCYINMAATWLEMEEYSKVVQECHLALGLTNNSIKAYFRRGVAQTKLGNFDDARKDLNEAKRLNESSETGVSIQKAIDELDKQLTEYIRRSKQIAMASLDID